MLTHGRRHNNRLRRAVLAKEQARVLRAEDFHAGRALTRLRAAAQLGRRAALRPAQVAAPSEQA